MVTPSLQLLLMDDNVITISTHNVNGYARSKEFLHSMCNNVPSAIRGIQEHWLRPPYKKQFGINQLRCLHPDFNGFGTSAMKKSSESKVNIGRPYGGTGFVYSNSYSKCLRPLLNYSHKRFTVMELCTDSCKIILINAYMPYFNSRDLTTYLTMYRETLGYIENIMSQHSDCQFIILADLNCNISDMTHCYSKLVRKWMTDYGLISTFDLVDNFDWKDSFTRYDKITNSHTLIDAHRRS